MSGSEADMEAPSTSHQAESSLQEAAATSLTPSPRQAQGGGREVPPRQASVAAREVMRRWTLATPAAKQEPAVLDELGPCGLLLPSDAQQSPAGTRGGHAGAQRPSPGAPSRQAGFQHSPPRMRSNQEVAAPVVEAGPAAGLQGGSPRREGLGGGGAPAVRGRRWGSTGPRGAAPAQASVLNCACLGTSWRCSTCVRVHLPEHHRMALQQCPCLHCCLVHLASLPATRVCLPAGAKATPPL